MLLGMLPAGVSRMRPTIVIVQGEPAGMGAPVGDSLRPPTFLIAKYSEVSPFCPIVSRYALLILDLKVNASSDAARKKPFGYHSTTALSQEAEVAANVVLGVNCIVTAAAAENTRSDSAMVTEICDNVVAED